MSSHLLFFWNVCEEFVLIFKKWLVEVTSEVVWVWAFLYGNIYIFIYLFIHLLFILSLYMLKIQHHFVIIIYFLSFKRAERGEQVYIYRIFILSFLFAMSGYFCFFLWIRVTIWCHFSHSMYLSSHLSPLCCYYDIHLFCML